MDIKSTKHEDGRHIFCFEKDVSKEGRVLSHVQVGGVFMSRLVVEPGVVTGNYFYTSTHVLMSVEFGTVLARFEHVHTKEKKELQLRPGLELVEIPKKVASATKNIGTKPAVIVFFSDKPLRTSEAFHYKVF
tara:strand:+ start:272 stop:667 length:396 start_codon:yes stop_codon:yes gene_type:complete